MGNGASGGSDLATMAFPTQFNRYFEYVYAQEILFVLCVTVVKLSILVFYRHLFSVGLFVHINWGLILICIIWSIITIFVVIFQCNPIYTAWRYDMQRTGRAVCISPAKMVFCFEITNMAIDIAILIPSIVTANRLQINAAKRAGVMGIFLLGIFVCITCAIRAYYVWNPATGEPRSMATTMDWSTIELASAIICACLPTYGPVFVQRRNVSVRRHWPSESQISSQGEPRASFRNITGQFSNRGEFSVGHDGQYFHLEAKGRDSKLPNDGQKGL
ncbi:hypothetical protein N7468_003834 [Penicillium chermesinum]|uniref:Rhodopsin domain-containing protein n=1 Tax=Penicillium chermesinum TaxID=63820 RepID=A0A9W9TRZ8_9EURO|nr:uncharacterized protein N7468_003834 [Penicillium chermesinum]KAJ5239215.1 hypothetical protein N7468_003834 [Penicillium chermesinum]